MSQAGEALRILNGACVNDGEERKYRRLRTLQHQQREPIGELVNGDALLERGNVLGDRRRDEENCSQCDPYSRSHESSTKLKQA